MVDARTSGNAGKRRGNGAVVTGRGTLSRLCGLMGGAPDAEASHGPRRRSGPADLNTPETSAAAAGGGLKPFFFPFLTFSMLLSGLGDGRTGEKAKLYVRAWVKYERNCLFSTAGTSKTKTFIISSCFSPDSTF